MEKAWGVGKYIMMVWYVGLCLCAGCFVFKEQIMTKLGVEWEEDDDNEYGTGVHRGTTYSDSVLQPKDTVELARYDLVN